MDLSGLSDAVLSWAETPWLLVAIFVLTTVDGFFPPFPSESVVIAAAVLITSGTGPSLWLLVVAAAAGAFAGDLIAYHLGMLIPLEKVRFLGTPRGRRTMAWAEAALERRAAVLIISARFIPIGRVAVNMTAGAVRFPLPRFMLTVALASVVWASYATLLGIVAGHWFEEHPLVAVALGVVMGLAMGFVVDAALSAVNRWLERRREHGPVTRVGDALARATAPPEVVHLSEGELPPDGDEPA